MMEYPRLNKIVRQLCLDADDVSDLINAYADDLEESEPYATRAIQAARDTASGMVEEIE